MNKIQDCIEKCLGEDETIQLLDGFDEAFIGIARQFNTPFAIYNRAKCIEILCKDMTWIDAEEHFQYNVEGAYVGESTPAFLCTEE